MTTAHPARLVLRALWQRRRNQGSMWPMLLFVPGFALLGWLGGRLLHLPVVTVVAAMSGLLVAAAWFWLVSELQAQNEPHAARLVPGHLRTLRQVWAGIWLAIVAIAGGIGGWFGHLVGAGLVAGALLVLIAWLVRWPWLGFGGWLLGIGARQPNSPSVRGVLADHDPGQLAWAALLLMAVVGTLYAVLQQGGEAHRRRYRGRVKRAADPTRPRGPHNRLQFGMRHAAMVPYRYWLARMSTARDAAPLPRALLGLGPMLHWSGIGGFTLVYVGTGLVFWGAVWMIDAPAHRFPFAGLDVLGVFGMLFFSLLSAGIVHVALYRTRREQALLMLLPGMPRAAALNLRLTRHLVLQFAGCWLVFSGLLVLLASHRQGASGWVLSVVGVSLWPMPGSSPTGRACRHRQRPGKGPWVCWFSHCWRSSTCCTSAPTCPSACAVASWPPRR